MKSISLNSVLNVIGVVMLIGIPALIIFNIVTYGICSTASFEF